MIHVWHPMASLSTETSSLMTISSRVALSTYYVRALYSTAIVFQVLRGPQIHFLPKVSHQMNSYKIISRRHDLVF